MHIHTSIVTTTTCPKCGTIEKSGKASWCGRGGSWFKNCGSSGNKKQRHTLREGILAYKTRSQLEVVRLRQRNVAQQLNYSYIANIENFEAVFTAAETFINTSVNTSTPMPTGNALNTTLDNTSTIYDNGTKSYKATATSAYTISVASTTKSSIDMLTATAAPTSTLTTTTTATTVTTATTITAAVVSTTMIIRTVKETTVASEWIPQGKYHACNI